MFHKVTMLVYLLFGAMLGAKVADLTKMSGAQYGAYILLGALVSVALYYMLRVLRFAESAYRREMVAAPQIFKSGQEVGVKPSFTETVKK